MPPLNQFETFVGNQVTINGRAYFQTLFCSAERDVSPAATPHCLDYFIIAAEVLMRLGSVNLLILGCFLYVGFAFPGPSHFRVHFRVSLSFSIICTESLCLCGIGVLSFLKVWWRAASARARGARAALRGGCKPHNLMAALRATPSPYCIFEGASEVCAFQALARFIWVVGSIPRRFTIPS